MEPISLRPIPPQRVFAAVGTLFGVLFTLIVPPFQVPDEVAHFLRAFQISEGTFIGDRRADSSGGMLPASLLEVGGRAVPNLAFHVEQRVHRENIAAALALPLEPERREFLHFSNTVLYPPPCYFPQAIGIAIGRALQVSPLMLMYLGRLTNLIVWLGLGYYALAIMPVAHWGMALLLLTPMSLFEAASLSADASTNGTAFLFIAMCLSTALDGNRVSRQRWSTLVALGVVLALLKPHCVILTSLLLIIPSERFGTRTCHGRCLVVAGTCTLLVWAVWQLCVHHLHVPLKPNAPAPAEQLRFIAFHPRRFADMVMDTFALYGRVLLEGFIGVLGWLDTRLPTWLVRSYWGMLILAAVAGGRVDANLRSSQRVLALGIVATFALLLLVLLQATWNPVGNTIIEGLQSRYFIWVSALLYVACYQRRFQIQSDLWSVPIAAYTMLSGTATSIALLQRYYW